MQAILISKDVLFVSVHHYTLIFYRKSDAGKDVGLKLEI